MDMSAFDMELRRMELRDLAWRVEASQRHERLQRNSMRFNFGIAALWAALGMYYLVTSILGIVTGWFLIYSVVWLALSGLMIWTANRNRRAMLDFRRAATAFQETLDIKDKEFKALT